MKTLEQVKMQIAQNEAQAINSNLSDAQIKGICRETEQLRLAQRYLEHNPSEDYLKKEVDQMEAIIKAKMKQFDFWMRAVKPYEIDPKDALSHFNKENGLTALRRQIKFINFILE